MRVKAGTSSEVEEQFAAFLFLRKASIPEESITSIILTKRQLRCFSLSQEAVRQGREMSLARRVTALVVLCKKPGSLKPDEKTSLVANCPLLLHLGGQSRRDHCLHAHRQHEWWAVSGRVSDFHPWCRNPDD